MKILVSACLMGENCKYDGGNNRNEKVLEYVAGHEVFTVCPEVMGGLPTPRIPSEIKNGEVVNKEGKSVHKEFCQGACIALEIAEREGVDLAILKARSPSCGSREIYDGTFSKNLVEGQGIFAHMLAEKGIRIVSEEEL